MIARQRQAGSLELFVVAAGAVLFDESAHILVERGIRSNGLRRKDQTGGGTQQRPLGTQPPPSPNDGSSRQTQYSDALSEGKCYARVCASLLSDHIIRRQMKREFKVRIT